MAQIGKRDDLVLDSIVVDASDSRHLIVGAWVVGQNEDGGLFTSADGGATWLNQPEMHGQSVRSLAASSSDPKTLVAGSLQGVFRSTDGGRRWARISPTENAEIHEVASVAIDPTDSRVIYAGTWHLPWKTVDGGEHWESIKQGIIDDSDVFSIIVDPISPQTVYASACSGIYKSDDGGGMFHKVEGIPSTARRTRVLLQDPTHLDIVFAGTTEGLYRSDDAGKSWNRLTGPEITVNSVSVDSADPRRILIATDRGGVMASEDGGDSFHSSNGGFSARQITTLKHDFNRPNTVYVGIVNDKDWGGVFQSDNGGINWVQRSDGLQGRDVFSIGQAPDGTIIAGTAHGIYRLDSASETWQRAQDVPTISPVADSMRGVPRIVRTHNPVDHKLLNNHKSGQPGAGVRREAALSKPRHQSASKSLRSAPHQAQLLAGRQHSRFGKLAGGAAESDKPTRGTTQVAARGVGRPTLPSSIAPVLTNSFDGGVYAIVTAGPMLLVTTSSGLLSSADNGVSWNVAGPPGSTDWRFLASAKNNIVAGSLHSVAFSADSGATWSPIKLPEEVSQISTIAVAPSGEIWIGSREGVFVSPDAGNVWSTPKNLYVTAVNNIFYDEPSNSVIVTTSGAHGIVFTVQLPQKSVSYYESGWTLRFARPVGDHLVAATLFDGLVVQPRMLISPIQEPLSSTAAAVSHPER